MNDKIYEINGWMRDNWLGLFEEMQINGEDGPARLFAWWMGEQNLIQQSIDELISLEPIPEEEYDGTEVDMELMQEIIDKKVKAFRKIIDPKE